MGCMHSNNSTDFLLELDKTKSNEIQNTNGIKQIGNETTKKPGVVTKTKNKGFSLSQKISKAITSTSTSKSTKKSIVRPTQFPFTDGQLNKELQREEILVVMSGVEENKKNLIRSFVDEMKKIQTKKSGGRSENYTLIRVCNQLKLVHRRLKFLNEAITVLDREIFIQQTQNDFRLLNFDENGLHSDNMDREDKLSDEMDNLTEMFEAQTAQIKLWDTDGTFSAPSMNEEDTDGSDQIESLIAWASSYVNSENIEEQTEKESDDLTIPTSNSNQNQNQNQNQNKNKNKNTTKPKNNKKKEKRKNGGEKNKDKDEDEDEDGGKDKKIEDTNLEKRKIEKHVVFDVPTTTKRDSGDDSDIQMEKIEKTSKPSKKTKDRMLNPEDPIPS